MHWIYIKTWCSYMSLNYLVFCIQAELENKVTGWRRGDFRKYFANQELCWFISGLPELFFF